MNSEIIRRNFEILYKECADSRNGVYLSKILASWLEGESVLPQRLGLDSSSFNTLMKETFHQTEWIEKAPSGIEVPERVNPEKEELISLFLEHRNGSDPTELWIATIMAAGCLGKDHLWHDLGLWARSDLSAMIQENFSALFEKNTQNMRWKKFFYKQMCLDLEITYTCKSPTCGECVDYHECFDTSGE